MLVLIRTILSSILLSLAIAHSNSSPTLTGTVETLTTSRRPLLLPTATYTSHEPISETSEQRSVTTPARIAPISIAGSSPWLHPLALVLLLLAFLGFISTLDALPFQIMPSSSSAPKPSSSSSSSKERPSSSKDRPTSSSSSSSRPSSSSSSSSSSAKPPQATPYITANAWMSFFLFVCLVLIILQGPLGLTGGSGLGNFWPGSPSWCAGNLGASVPWCQTYPPYPPAAGYVAPLGKAIPMVGSPLSPPIAVTPVIQVQQAQAPQVIVHDQQQQMPQVGGQGIIATPGGEGGYSWYANPPQTPRQARVRPQGVNVQYQRPGLQIQVSNGESKPVQQIQHQNGATVPLMPVAVAAAPAVAPAVPAVPVSPGSPPAALGNVENAFYPLLVGAIALLVIFDYAS
ncbi:hypothetical protein BD324DRAFT_653220 [Kockovaella imperatae]|uniref:Uncharacterized protein n=1 Tax=Kockovaella imperatae TaxID=4999 RepID=A0A1Y1U8U0_9TREE|nr:hypothetical protein BD324DRAFT_653220 [Kockovaella imperatae]ORX34443.1 hypothetical protein BD324DRAFT_653220 [Kockovaella imperatae]